MSWREQLDELSRRRDLARQMGGEEQVARQHSRGKLAVRERIKLLADDGSFNEFGILVSQATCDGIQLESFTPKDEVTGSCAIDGRQIMISAGDCTVLGGSRGRSAGGLGVELRPAERALQWRVPYMRLLDASGGSVASFAAMDRTDLPDGNIWTATGIELLQTVPVASAVLGSVAGLPTINARLSHFSVMVRGTSQVFPGGPPMVKEAGGIEIDKDELVGAHIHKVSGVINNAADTEKDSIDQVRRFLSYPPSSVHEMAPRDSTSDRSPVLPLEEMRSVVPANQRQPTDVRKLLRGVVDPGSLFKIAPEYGRARITAFARVNGYPVGIMANNARHLGGSTDAAAGDKVIHLIQLCDQFHLLLVSFADKPGFRVGPEAECAGIETAGARLVWETCRSRMPWITFVIGRLFGGCGQCHHRLSGMFRRYAWPSARWGSIHISGGTSAAYRRVIEAADDPAAKLREIEETLEALAAPFRTAEATGQDIINPADTRACLTQFVTEAQRVLQQQLGPPINPYRP